MATTKTTKTEQPDPAPLDIRTDAKGLKRRAVRFTKALDSQSLDVIDKDGKLLCRLNVFAFPGGKGNVDVILNLESETPTQQGSFLAWQKGAPLVRTTTPEGVNVHAVAINPVQKEVQS